MRSVLLVLLLFGDGGWLPPAASVPPQLVVVSFDGAGDAPDLAYWTAIGAAVHARFTFFLSGVYLLSGDRAELYSPPRHRAGTSDIGFALAPDGTDVRANIRDLVSALDDADAAGYEIASHFNGHFCGRTAGAVGSWGPTDWAREIAAFGDLVAHVGVNNELPGVMATFGPVAGARTPCFEGFLPFERQALAVAGYRYDASEPADRAPYRDAGVWELPIPLMDVVGTGFRTLATDYNLYLNQSGANEAEPAELPALRDQALASYRAYFQSHYDGSREPLFFAHHFEDWNGGIYSAVLAQLLGEICGRRDVRCITYRELVSILDAASPSSDPRSSP